MHIDVVEQLEHIEFVIVDPYNPNNPNNPNNPLHSDQWETYQKMHIILCFHDGKIKEMQIILCLCMMEHVVSTTYNKHRKANVTVT